MAGRTFAQLNCSLLRSRKMQNLGHAESWTYICAHLTPLSSFTGVFTYPSVMWARDAKLSDDALHDVAARLVGAHLIEWEAGEELVRIVGFHRQRPPENASRSHSLIADFEVLLREHDTARGIVLRGAAEFAVAAIMRAQGWKPESPDMPKLRDALGRFLRATYQEDGEPFLDALAAEAEVSSKAARQELGALLPPLLMHRRETVATPCPQGMGTRDVDETRRDLDEEKNLDADEDAPASVVAKNEQMWRPVGAVEGLRRGTSGPLESTKRSRLGSGG